MQQKTIWVAVSIIGILISALSCKKDIDKAQYEEYYYVNNSNYAITITVFNKKGDGFLETSYSMAANGVLSQELELFSGSITGLIPLCDSVTIVFGTDRISHFVPGSSSDFSILNLNNYLYLKKSDNRRSYTYTFTEEDYQNAVEL